MDLVLLRIKNEAEQFCGGEKTGQGCSNVGEESTFLPLLKNLRAYGFGGGVCL